MVTNDMLETFLDSIGYPSEVSTNRIIGRPQVRYWIPIKFWIYRDDNGNGGPTPVQIQRLMDDLNFRFNQNNNTMIGFYQKCEPSFINNSTHTEKTTVGAAILMADNNDHGSINVHIIERFASGGAGLAVPLVNGAMVPRGSYSDPEASGDLAHEIGHVLGLSHTHQYSAWNWGCLTESVSRTRTWPTFNFCPTRFVSGNVSEATGDALRDTPADNNLVSNNACFYNVTSGTDPWGDSYDNPPAGFQDRANVRNIMSYNSATDCVDQFSRLQIAVMLRTIIWRKTNNVSGWKNPISTFDSFEADNQPETAREIQLNQVQERNFHQQWNRTGGFGYTTQCDVDWVRFVAPCNGSFTVFTSSMPGMAFANTRLTLFNNNLVQLAQNDDISSTNNFSSIQFNFVSGNEYFIRIENMSISTTGYYTLQISSMLSVAGDDNFCATSNNFTVTNLPLGATVQWQVTPLGIITINSPNSTQTTLTRNGNGMVMLTATVSNICGGPVTISKTIAVGVPDRPKVFDENGQAITTISACTNVYESLCPTIDSRWGVLEWEWERVIGNFNLIDFNSCADVLGFQPGSGFISVRVRNACGWSNPTFIVANIADCSSMTIQQKSINLFPNPASSSVTLSVNGQTSLHSKTKGEQHSDDVSINEVKIYDSFSNVKLYRKYNRQHSATIDVSTLPKGVYIVEINTGSRLEYQQLMTQK
ncbi:pre-peptidase C-terminal domain-containing protein [Flavisolibacter sp. BT320]|nr:pre-peptidase C-terminal domain-containing protein [Flavisolibacter longurius]